MVLLYDVDVYSPRSLDEALEILEKERDNVKVIAGGTDLIIQMKDGIVPRKNLLNIYPLDELRYIKLENNEVMRIGALTSFYEIATSPLVRNYAKILAEAAWTIGSIQIMNKATIGGNIVNASPAADSLPPLYVMDAVIVTRSLEGVREVPIDRFYRGYKKLDLRSNELVVEVRLRTLRNGEDGVFLKHGLRLGDAISVVNTALLIRWGKDLEVGDARVALGAVAPTVVRARDCEDYLRGRRLDSDEVMWEAAERVLGSISPIDDIRGSAEYRREVSVNLVYIALWELVRRRREWGDG